MTKDKFEQLVTFWSLRAAISNGQDLGRKIVEGVVVQNKRIRLTSDKYMVQLTYSVSEDDDFNIISADVYDCVYRSSRMVYGAECDSVLESL